MPAFEAGAIDYLLKRCRMFACKRRWNGPAACATSPSRLPTRLPESPRLRKHPRLLATQTLRGVEERLPAGKFQRVDRNALVNLNHIRKMSALSSQRWLLTLSKALEMVVSKRQAHNIRQILHG